MLSDASECRGDPVCWHGLSFFPRQAVAREEPVDRAITEGQSLGIDLSAKFFGGDVRCRLDKRHNQILVRLDTLRTPVAAQGAGAGLALFARQLPPAAHTRGTHTKTCARLALVGFPPNSIENSGAWIKKSAFDMSAGLLFRQTV